MAGKTSKAPRPSMLEATNAAPPPTGKISTELNPSEQGFMKDNMPANSTIRVLEPQAPSPPPPAAPSVLPEPKPASSSLPAAPSIPGPASPGEPARTPGPAEPAQGERQGDRRRARDKTREALLEEEETTSTPYLSARVPARLKNAIENACLERKHKKQEPFIIQNVVRQALEDWLTKNNFPTRVG